MQVAIFSDEKAETFCAIFQQMKVMSDFVTLHFGNDQFYIQLMDSAHVSIMEVRIPCAWFDKYELDDDVPCDITVSTLIFSKILNSRDKMQNVHLVFSNEDNDKMVIQFNTPAEEKTTNVFDKEYVITLIDLSNDMVEIPAETVYEAEMSFPSSRFAGIVSQLKMFGDTMEIECSEEAIVLYSTSTESGKMCVRIKMDDLTEFSITENESMKLAFSLHHLHTICLHHKLAKEITLSVTSQFPMRVHYNLGFDANIVFYLAPKIDDN